MSPTYKIILYLVATLALIAWVTSCMSEAT